MDEAAIREFFDGLTDARGFSATTTAVDGWATPRYPTNSFEQWLHDVFCRVIRHNLEPFNDTLTDTAVIAGGQRSRLFERGRSELRPRFLARLGDEARGVDDPWLNLVLPVSDGPVDLAGIVPPEVDTRGSTGWLMWWFLEMRGRGLALRMSGSAVLTAERASMWSHDLWDPPPWFDRILRGHPARRRHPIRRS